MRIGQEIMQGTHTAKLFRLDGYELNAKFTCIDISLVPPYREPSKLILDFDDRRFEATGSDYFAALDQIRLKLEVEGLFPRINGANRNCYPSGMARDMGAGLHVYKLVLGKPWGDLTDAVATFGNEATLDIVSVAEQKEFFEKWMVSVGWKI
jgi:hypothetical protein